MEITSEGFEVLFWKVSKQNSKYFVHDLHLE